MLWLIFAGLTVVAVLSIVWPLVKAPRDSSWRAFAIDVYKAQVAEIDRDSAQGLVAPNDATGAKAEAARRFLAAAETPIDHPPSSKWKAWAASIAAMIFVPALALGLYVSIGHPGLPDAPLAARHDAEPARIDMAAAIARIEAHLEQNPDDGRGYEVLAPVYLRIGRGQDAVRAYAAALRLLGDNVERRTRYGEALVFAANGVVTAEAKAAFEAVLAKDPSAKMPRFFLGLAAEQNDEVARARDYWNTLLAEEPANSPLAEALRQRIAALSGPGEAGRASLAAKLESLPAAEQTNAIRGMVERLATRLSQNGQDVEGWLRLVRAYAVLQDADKARKALLDAKRNLATDAPAIARIDALARELGLES